MPAKQAYPRGYISLTGSSRSFHELDPYHQRRATRLARRGVEEVGIDDHGDMHAIMPNGRRVRIRRQPRRLPQVYCGFSLSGWIDLIQHSHQIGPMGWAGLIAAQLLLHEAWPRTVPRRRRTLGDRATDRIQRVL